MTHLVARSIRRTFFLIATFSMITSGFAAPIVMPPSQTVMSLPNLEEVRYRGQGQRHRYTRGQHYNNRNSNGFPAAALGIFALGTAAIIAGNRQSGYDCGYYDGDCGDYNSGYYSNPYYGNRTYYGRPYYRRSYGGRGYYNNGDVNSDGINGGGR
jgi:hypothetical protein